MANRKTKSKAGRRHPRPSKTCRICRVSNREWTNKDWTEEHAYPEWLRKRSNAFHKAMPPGVAMDGWDQIAALKLSPVCVPCQRRLNVAFENPARELLKEMLGGSRVVLSPTQQVAVGSWLVKTALVIVLAREVKARALGDAVVENLRVEMHEMLERGTPSANATVRIAHLTQSLESTGARFLPAGSKWRDLVLSSTITLLNVLVETVLGTSPVVINFIDRTKNDDRFVRLWPPEGAAVTWPPGRDLSFFSDPLQLRTEWGHPNETTHATGGLNGDLARAFARHGALPKLASPGSDRSTGAADDGSEKAS